jgi:hypothetical protein
MVICAMLPDVTLARRYRRSIATIAMAALAFAQAAVAMHACVIPVPHETAMPCHDAPPPDPSALCHAHCQADQQTVDQAKPLAAAVVVAPLLAVVEIAIAVPPPHAVRSEPVLAHAASPPLPILYQRLRN